MRTIKTIKFNLPINGKRVRNIEELRQNMTPEILALYDNGQLGRWLKSRNLADYQNKINAISAITAADRLLEICQIFSIEMTLATARAIVKATSNKPNNSHPGPEATATNSHLHSAKKKMKRILHELPSIHDSICDDKIIDRKIKITDLFYDSCSRLIDGYSKNNKDYIFGIIGSASHLIVNINADDLISKNIIKSPGIDKYQQNLHRGFFSTRLQKQ